MRYLAIAIRRVYIFIAVKERKEVLRRKHSHFRALSRAIDSKEPMRSNPYTNDNPGDATHTTHADQYQYRLSLGLDILLTTWMSTPEL